MALHRSRYETAKTDFGEDVLRLLARPEPTGFDTARAYHLTREWSASVKRVFDTKVDVIIAPTVNVVAPTPDAARALPPGTLTRLTFPLAAARIPSLSLPAGFGKDGLPIGIQLASGNWNEPLLFSLGRAYQRETDWHRLRPPLD